MFLKISQNSQVPVSEPFLKKICRTATLLKKILGKNVFPVHFEKFLRTSFLRDFPVAASV